MQYFTLFPLNGYWGKFAGLAIITLSLGLLAIHEISGPHFLEPIITAEKQTSSLLWVFSLGLYILTSSKEKIDDERVQKVRYTALRALAFFFFIGSFFLLNPMLSDPTGASGEIGNSDSPLILLLLVLPLIGYQIIFNIGLYLNPDWVYNDLGAEENLRKHPKFFLIYFGLVTVLLLAFLAIKALSAN